MPEQTKHTKITDEIVSRARGRIGKSWKPREPFFNTQATRDTIRHFCNGIGDTNPLYRDEEYAQKSRFGKIVAPPCFLYSIYWPVALGLLMPGLHAWHAGNDWEWFKPILEGDEFSCEVTPTKLEEKESLMAKRTFIGHDETNFINQRGEIIAKVEGWSVIAERQAAQQGGKYRDLTRASYSTERLREIQAAYERELIRGATPRYWEEIQIGDELNPVIKGPLSVRDIICFMMGAGSPYYRAHGIFLAYQKRHPAIGMIDSTTGEIDIPELVHVQDSRAGEIGINVAYDYGPQRISWLGHLLTNWMGDDGFLKRLKVEIIGFNMVGDTTWCKGKIIQKYVDGDQHLVDVECWAEDQRARITAKGQATIVLTTR